MAPLTQEELGRRILYEDEGVVVVDKPWGIPSTGLNLDDDDCVQHALIERYAGMTWAAHQLDADTSGVNVFLRRKMLVPRWQARMRHPNGTKTYLAVVHGPVRRDAQTMEHPIGIIRRDPSPVLGVCATGRAARTRLEVLQRTDRHSLLRVRIETGRTHQIRIHLESIQHPLVGEKWYRAPRCDLHPRQALHAWSLAFDDDVRPRRIESPIPEDLCDLIGALFPAVTDPRRPEAQPETPVRTVLETEVAKSRSDKNPNL